MKIAVVGAGIVGVTTAYELAADGHEVSVFERRGSVAAEASFANGGVIAPGCVASGAWHGMPSRMLSTLFGARTPLRVRGLGGGTFPWLWRWWRAGRPRTVQAQRLHLQRLAAFSRDRLRALSTELKLDYERSDGVLVLWRTEREAALAQRGLASLSELGLRHELLDGAACRVVEPNLSPETPLHGGVHLPDDEVGNCRQFAHLLRGAAEQLGVQFNFHTAVQRIDGGPTPQLVHLHTPPSEQSTLSFGVGIGAGAAGDFADALDTQPMPPRPVTEDFDAIVVCAAHESAALLRPLGLRLPLQAVHGYSITAPLRHSEIRGDHGPRSALIDDCHQVAITRIGSRVRVAGGAELGGRSAVLHPRSLAPLYKVLHDWFPGSAHLSQAQRWKGAQPMLPDGPPVVGRSGADGVWLNLGHGASGWALACGSARLLADTLVGRVPTIGIDGLGIERLRG